MAGGCPPAAAAWASNEDEWRKALLSHFRVGAASFRLARYVYRSVPRLFSLVATQDVAAVAV